MRRRSAPHLARYVHHAIGTAVEYAIGAVLLLSLPVLASVFVATQVPLWALLLTLVAALVLSWSVIVYARQKWAPARGVVERINTILDASQQIVHGAWEATDEDLINQAILWAGYEHLNQDRTVGDRISLAVLEVSEHTKAYVVMTYCWGHSFQTRKSFHERLDGCAYQNALRSNGVKVSANPMDRNYKPIKFPHDHNSYRDFFAVPIRRGKQPFGILLATALEEGAIQDGEEKFLETMAHMIEVSWPRVLDIRARDAERRPAEDDIPF